MIMNNNVTVFDSSGPACVDATGDLPREFPLKLIVNGKELATLVASPHDPRFLVAGFLRLQGYVADVSDFEMLSVCEDYGIANVRIKREVKDLPAPIITSGCGGGISFRLPGLSLKATPSTTRIDGRRFTPVVVFQLFEALHRFAERYRRHGGIHSAAVGDGDTVLLHAEDLGRHNTIDRLAGEALLRGLDLKDTMLITSGRISSEMAAKAALLGVSLVASRTSPTDLAVKICDSAGITLIGYVRGGRFNVYCHEGRLCAAK